MRINVDAAQTYGDDAALERAANDLLRATGEADDAALATFRITLNRSSVPLDTVDGGSDGVDDEREELTLADVTPAPDAEVMYTASRIVSYAGGYALARPASDAIAAVMSVPPLNLPAHRPRNRFQWAVGQGGYMPPASRDGRCLITTLGRVKLTRLVRVAEANPYKHHARALVQRWMGAIPGGWRPSDTATAHHTGAVKGRRRTAAEIAALNERDAPVFDPERMMALANALAVGGQVWTDRVG